MSKINFTYFNPNDRQEWLRLRDIASGKGTVDKVAFGGSEISVIMGLNAYKADIQLFHELVGTIKTERVDRYETYRGQCLEPVIYDKYWVHYDPTKPEKENTLANISAGKVIRKARSLNAIVTNSDFPYLFSNFDKVINKSKYGPQGILEIKSLTSMSMSKWQGGLDPSYVLQPQSYMMVGGYSHAELFALVDATYPECYHFQRNDELFQSIAVASENFAKRILEAKRIKASDLSEIEKDIAIKELEPTVGAGEAWKKFLKDNHNPDLKKPVLDGNQEQLDLVIEYLSLKDEIVPTEERIDLLENQIRNTFRVTDSNEIYFKGLGKISWKNKLSIPKTILTKYTETV